VINFCSKVENPGTYRGWKKMSPANGKCTLTLNFSNVLNDLKNLFLGVDRELIPKKMNFITQQVSPRFCVNVRKLTIIYRHYPYIEISCQSPTSNYSASEEN